MKVIGVGILEQFARNHQNVSTQIWAWRCEVEEATWQSPKDIKDRYVSASFLDDNRVIFNLKGNKYRLDVKVSYKHQVVLVKRIGTHSEYSKWKF